MADSDLELSGRFGLPEIGGFAARLEGRYTRRWTSRSKGLVEVASKRSKLSPEEIAKRLEEHELLSDLFWKALSRAAGVADPEYRDALGQLVGAALDDEVRVHEIDHLTSELLKLEPLHLRVLLCGFEAYVEKSKSGDGSDLARAPFSEAGWLSTKTVSPEFVGRSLRISEFMATAGIQVLAAAGFFKPTLVDIDATIRSRGMTPLYKEAAWRPSPWAMEAMYLIHPNVTGIN